DLAGTGFNGTAAQLVMSGHFTAQGQAPGSTANSGTTGNLDQFGTDNYTSNDTVGSTGNTALLGTVDSVNSSYFTFATGETLVGSMVNVKISTQLQLPFISVNPSAHFLTGTTNTAVGGTPVLAGAGLGTQATGLGIGSVNGQNGNSVQDQQDANLAITPLVTK